MATSRSLAAALVVKQKTVVIRERVYIPVNLVNKKEVKDNYTTHLYEDRSCKICEHYEDRHSYLCDTCPSFKGKVMLYKTVTRGGVAYIGIPTGDKKNFERKTGLLYKETTFKDIRVKAPFDYPIKFLATLRDYQTPVIEEFLVKKYGQLEAPPRTGKTLMALYICLQLGQKVIMLANQHEFLTQFIDHIQGNLKEEIPKCTNLPELEKKYKKKLYGFPKTDEDFENFQIFTCTYQQFLSETNGLNRFKKIEKQVGTLFVDEVHKANADGFARVVSMFPSRYKFGVTATSERKDKRHFIASNILGPVVARSKRESLIPTVIVHKTEAKPKRKYQGQAGWVYAMQFLAKDKKRNALIVEWVMKDLKNGHNIVIPVQFKAHALELMTLVNAAFGRKICEMFIGGGGAKNKEARKEILSRVKSNKIRVTVGIRSILQLGLNVPTWSCIYTAMPISNEPNYRQETSRIRTPLEGKRSPIVRLFVDIALGQSVGCARNCIKQMRGFGYLFKKTEKQSALVYEVLGTSRQDDDSSGEAQFKAHKNTAYKPSAGAWAPASRPPVKRL